MRYHENYIRSMDPVAILLRNEIFSLLGHFLSVLPSLIFCSYKFHKIRLMNLRYHTWSQNHICVSRWRFGISIFGTQMTVILDLVNKSWTNVAEMHLIGFVDPENITLDTKRMQCIWYHENWIWCIDTAAIFKIAIFSRSNIFSDIKIYKIRSRNLTCRSWRTVFFSNGPRTNTIFSSIHFALCSYNLIGGNHWAKLYQTTFYSIPYVR